jgi:hypothetical protein
LQRHIAALGRTFEIALYVRLAMAGYPIFFEISGKEQRRFPYIEKLAFRWHKMSGILISYPIWTLLITEFCTPERQFSSAIR